LVCAGGGANVLRGERRSTHGGRLTPTAAPRARHTRRHAWVAREEDRADS
jgi:hypothetical protein